MFNVFKRALSRRASTVGGRRHPRPAVEMMESRTLLSSVISITGDGGTAQENAGMYGGFSFIVGRDTIPPGGPHLAEFQMSGQAKWTGADADYNLSGYAEFDPATGKGKVQLSTSGSVALRVAPIQDSLYEGNESVTATLIGPPPSGHVIGSPSSATGTIIDDDPQPLTVSVAAVEAEAKEAGPVRGRLKFTRSGGSGTSSSLSVNYRVRNPSPAEAGIANDTDYTIPGSASSGGGYTTRTLTFNSGQTEVTVDVTPSDDVLPEGDETATFEVVPRAGGPYPYSPPAIVAGGSPATITIKDKPVVSMALTDGEARELGEEPGGFSVNLARPHTESVTVRFRLPGGAGVPLTIADLTTPALSVDAATGDLVGSVTIPAGATSADVSVKPVRDLLKEGDETAAFSLKADPAYAIGTTGGTNASVRITDLAVVSIAATDTATEGAANGAGFTVSRTHDGNRGALAVGLELGAGTAIVGQDFAALLGTVTIPDGSPSVFVPLSPVNDTTPEWTESLSRAVTLDNTKYLRGDVFSADAEIVDDDPASLSVADVITLNNDDDDANLVPDLEATGSVAGENDLAPLTLAFPADVKQGARVTLSASVERVKVWLDALKSQVLLHASKPSHTWTVGTDTIPTTVYVEALSGSVVEGDAGFTLSASDSSASPPPRRATSSSGSKSSTARGVRLVYAENRDRDDVAGALAGKVIIGQKVFVLAQPVGFPAGDAASFDWDVPGHVVADYLATDNVGVVTPLEGELLTREAVNFAWTDAGDGARWVISCEVTIAGRTYTPKTTFDVVEPTARIRVENGRVEVYTVVEGNRDGKLQLGGDLPPAGTLGMKFTRENFQVPAGFTGNTEWMQLVNSSVRREFRVAQNNWYRDSQSGIDGGYPYPADDANGETTSDIPGNPLDNTITESTADDDFTMYLMFRPETAAGAVIDSIPVPLRLFNWGWSGHARWADAKWSLVSGAVDRAQSDNSTEVHPEWNGSVQPRRADWLPET